MSPNLRCGDIPAARPDDVLRVADFETDGVPPSVLLVAGRRVTQEVLLAQFVGDAGGRAVEIARLPDDLRAAAAGIGDLPQDADVDGFVAPGAARRSAWIRRARRRITRRGDRRRPASTASAAWQRERERRRPALIL